MRGIAVVPLTTHQRALAVVDLDDLPRVLRYTWSLSARYAGARIDGRTVLLHRFVLGEPTGFVCHLNGEPLDCRKSNLLVASQSANMFQRPASGARNTVGVLRARGRWVATVLRRTAGNFATKDERGQGRLQVAGMRVTVCGGRLSLQRSTPTYADALDALRGLSAIAWSMAWRRSNRLIVKHLWGVGGVDFEVPDPRDWPPLLRETAAWL